MFMRAVHPGEILKNELAELGVSPTTFARQIEVPPNRISQIIAGKRSVTGDTALRFGHWFGTDPQFWLNLQTQFDLAAAERRSARLCVTCRLPLRVLRESPPGSRGDEMIRPTEVDERDGYRIWLKCSDGSAGEVDLSHLAGRGVFEIWEGICDLHPSRCPCRKKRTDGGAPGLIHCPVARIGDIPRPKRLRNCARRQKCSLNPCWSTATLSPTTM